MQGLTPMPALKNYAKEKMAAPAFDWRAT